MSDGWFYRESAGTRERGPVAKSDIDYLRSQGTIRPGMEVRSEFGEWSSVPVSGPTRAGRGHQSPAALPRIITKQPVVDVSTEKKLPPLPLPSMANRSPVRDSKRIIVAAVATIAVLLLLIFLFTSARDTGLQTGAGQDVADGNAEQESNSAKAATDPADQPVTEDKEQTSSSESELAGAGTSMQGNSSLEGPRDSAAASSGNTSVAAGSQPAPLDRNLKKNHILSPGAKFFGVTAAGQRFVFLIDASSSMLDGKDVAARRELVASVKRMAPHMELEVIFFTNTMTRLFGKFQSFEDRRQVISEIESAKPLTGGTPVMPALSEALGMEPDAIFLLTDGEFNEGDISGQTRTLNRNEIPINTIAFVNRSMESVLTKVASDSGGDYRYVAN